MTTTTTFQGMDPEAKSSSRVLRPPGGGSNISFGADEDKPAVRKDKMASSIFAEPEDPHAHRRNNPPGGKPTGVLCGEPSAPLRRCAPQSQNALDEQSSANGDNNSVSAESTDDIEISQEPVEQAEPPALGEKAVAGVPSGRRNPPGGKSSLILG